MKVLINKKGQFMKGHKPTNGFVKGHKINIGLKMSKNNEEQRPQEGTREYEAFHQIQMLLSDLEHKCESNFDRMVVVNGYKFLNRHNWFINGPVYPRF